MSDAVVGVEESNKTYVLTQPHKQRWWLHASLAILTIGISIGAFWSTWVDMVSIWLRSETFTHAFLIAPITLWLIYEKRDALLSRVPRFSGIGMALVFCGGGVWLLGTLMGAAVIQQLAAVGIVIALVLSCVGWSASWSIAFPLLFLFFMVPMGEDLVPPMMEFTADFTVEMVRLTGIPVYREGLFFMLPTGNWSVVEACSGVRYLIASITLGVLYAYLTYEKWWKRGIFILISIGVPIIANGLRAYMIVMLGHMSDMTVATGVDHLVYGWLFFGVVVFIMIRIGAFFKDEMVSDVASNTSALEVTSSTGKGKWTFAALIIVAVTVIWPVVYAIEQNQEYVVDQTAFDGEHWSEKEWALIQSPAWQWPWSPLAFEAIQSALYFENNEQRGGVFVDYYPDPAKGELINSQNLLVEPGELSKRVLSVSNKSLTFHNGDELPYELTRLYVSNTELWVASWYQVGGEPMVGTYKTKLWEGLSRLIMDRKDRARVMFVIEVDPLLEGKAQDTLEDLIRSRYPDLNVEMKTRGDALHER
jgi:exosortase A